MNLNWPNIDQPLFVSVVENKFVHITVEQWLRDVSSATQIAQQLGNRVLLYNDDFYAFSVWFFALTQTGRTVVLPPNMQPETLRQASEYADSTCPDTLPSGACNDTEATVKLLPATKIVFFTSGSTGEPKLIEKRIAQLWLEAEQLELAFSEHVATASLFAATVPAHHIYGLLFRLLWPLRSGKKLLKEAIEYSETLQLVVAQNNIALVSSPAHLSRFSDLQTGLLKAPTVFSSGGPLSFDIAHYYYEAFGQAPVEVFGSTETGGIAWRQSENECVAWQLFSSVSIKVGVDKRLNVKSPYLWDSNWLETEDLVEVESANTFLLMGRSDRVVKIAEKRVSLTEVENYCMKHPWLKQVRTLVLYGKRESLAAVVVLNASGQQQLKGAGKLAMNRSIREFLAERFDRVALPRKFRYISDLPYDSRGKVSMRLLKELF